MRIYVIWWTALMYMSLIFICCISLMPWAHWDCLEWCGISERRHYAEHKWALNTIDKRWKGISSPKQHNAQLLNAKQRHLTLGEALCHFLSSNCSQNIWFMLVFQSSTSYYIPHICDPVTNGSNSHKGEIICYYLSECNRTRHSVT